MGKNKELHDPIHSFKKLLRWVRHYWLSYVLMGVIVFVSSLIPTGTAEAMRRLMNAVFNASYSELWLAMQFFIVIFILGLVMEIVRAWFMQRMKNMTTLDLQRAVLDRMFMLNLKHMSQWHSGEQIQRLNGSAVTAQEGVNQKIPQVIEQALSILFCLHIYQYYLGNWFSASWLLPFSSHSLVHLWLSLFIIGRRRRMSHKLLKM
ncbi:hypothetical protein G4V62_02335 [Bacillaceae bacterium SIJ1]|uniref:hypothetical protein n=1 Tax=Litoribacterium kuwaitense TaxID=1398745 RepID=UPI001FEB116B|nr:hypothetical protein [Litoribacterium kuwaitense]NGP43843.1 hypothetical protein [Litoribacterium kuwaitense]